MPLSCSRVDEKTLIPWLKRREFYHAIDERLRQQDAARSSCVSPLPGVDGAINACGGRGARRTRSVFENDTNPGDWFTLVIKDVCGGRKLLSQTTLLSTSAPAVTSLFHARAFFLDLRHGRFRLHVPNVVYGLAGQAMLLFTVTSTDCRASPGTVASVNGARRK